MVARVRFYLNAILSPSRFVYLHENLHCYNGCRYGVICSRRKCYMYVTCGRNIIHDMTLSTEYRLRHMIKIVLEKNETDDVSYKTKLVWQCVPKSVTPVSLLTQLT